MTESVHDTQDDSMLPAITFFIILCLISLIPLYGMISTAVLIGGDKSPIDRLSLILAETAFTTTIVSIFLMVLIRYFTGDINTLVIEVGRNLGTCALVIGIIGVSIMPRHAATTPRKIVRILLILTTLINGILTIALISKQHYKPASASHVVNSSFPVNQQQQDQFFL